MFRCVAILASGEIQEFELSKSGGLESDELQKYLKTYFGVSQQTTTNRIALEQALKLQGTDPSSIDPRLLDHVNDARVEIKTLAPPTKNNNYMGVSMYTDANANENSHPLNSKATDISIRCGYTTPVYGDAFISRVFDNEEMEWTR
jgi:AraC-like DNA-binding protein